MFSQKTPHSWSRDLPHSKMGLHESPRESARPLGDDEFTIPYGWSNSQASSLAVVCQIMERGANPHDVRVAMRRWGPDVFRQAAAELDTSQAWLSEDHRAFAMEVIAAVTASWQREGRSV